MIAGGDDKGNTNFEKRSLPFSFNINRSRSVSLIKSIDVLNAAQDVILQLALSGRLGRVQDFDRLHRLKSWELLVAIYEGSLQDGF
jgi:hypothetical protein